MAWGICQTSFNEKNMILELHKPSRVGGYQVLPA